MIKRPRPCRATQYAVDRRTFLRGSVGGVGVSLALPLLDAMLDTHGVALAAGTPLPMCFGSFHWGNGISHETWVPRTEGYGWQSEAFGGFADRQLMEYVTLITGTNHVHLNDTAHIPARGIALSSSHDLTRGIPGAGNLRGQNHPEPSVDQVVAEAWAGQTRFETISAGICNRGPYQGNSSWKRGGRTKLKAELSPQRLFDRLFGEAAPNGQPSNAKLLRATTRIRSSMLDAVMADVSHFKRRAGLGVVDQHRLTSHLEGVRAIERRLQEIGDPADAGCNRPDRAIKADFGEENGQEQKQEKMLVMAPLLATAMACDLTRVLAFEWSSSQNQSRYPEVGVDPEHHQLSHFMGLPGNVIRSHLNKITRFIMDNFAILAAAMRDKTEGAGNLLDRTLLVGTSEHAWGPSHTYSDFPYVYVGKAKGRVKAGLHYRDPDPKNNTNAPKALLTAVRLAGVQVPKLGQDKSANGADRSTTETISAVEA